MSFRDPNFQASRFAKRKALKPGQVVGGQQCLARDPLESKIAQQIPVPVELQGAAPDCPLLRCCCRGFAPGRHAQCKPRRQQAGRET
jgi:hypothetical protein